MVSLKLSNANDLTIDDFGNLAFTGTENERIAQDVCTAILYLRGDSYFNTRAGIPYSSEIFGQSPAPFQLFKTEVEQAALAVTGVFYAQLVTTEFTDTKLSGYLLINQTLRISIWQ